MRRAVRILGVALILGASLRALWLLRDLALMGPDTLPLVLAARAEGVGAWLHGLFEPLFGDQIPAPYYRPLLYASFSLDQALHGLSPLGHHASSVAVAALCGLALLRLAGALGLSGVGALAALVFLMLHPVWGVVLPVPARRADGLCLLFTLLALAAQLRAVSAERPRAWTPALLAGLAIASKETGFVAPALCVLAAFAAPTLSGVGARARAARAALPPALAVFAAGALLRGWVLGDLLGDRPIRSAGLASAFADMLGRVLAQSFSARAVWSEARLPLPELALAAAIAGGLALRPGGDARPRLPAGAGAALGLAAAALAALAAGYTLGVLLQPWYLLLPAAFAALAVGALARVLAQSFSARAGGRQTRARRLAAAVGALALGAALLGIASDSFLWRGLGDWQRADRRAARYLEGLRDELERARPGERVEHAAPPAFGGARGPERMRGVVALAPYTVQAWATLAFPERRIRVVSAAAAERADDDEVLLALDASAPAGGTRATPDASPAPPAPSASATPPSFVVILADDLGYADLGFQGSDEIATPRLDALARQGVRFTDAYVTSPLCAPTRAALLTGRDPNRYGYTRATGTFQRQMRDDVGVPLTETLLPELLGRAGYATAAVGKWHLGVRPAYRPLHRGFDSFFGFLAGTHAYFDWGPGLYGPVFRNDRRVSGDEYLTFAFAQEAAAFVRAHADEPFFLYLAFHAVHPPLEAPDRHMKAYAHLEPPRRAVAAMTTALDEGVGRVLDALEETERAADTLVWFLNDNGGQPPLSSNAPLRGGKGDLYEGGIRVPSLLRWSAALAPGVYEAPVSVLDVLPTLVAAAGAPAPDLPSDGVDLLPHLRSAAQPPPHEALFWRYGDARAVRHGPWKLVEGPDGAALFHLPSDPGERRDLSADEPGRVDVLRARLDVWTRGLAATGSQVSERP